MNYRKVTCTTCDGLGRLLKNWVFHVIGFFPTIGRRLSLFCWAWEPCHFCQGSGLMNEFDPNPENVPGTRAPWLGPEDLN